MVVINNRGDRLQRAEQFGDLMAKDLKARCFFLVGEYTHATEEIAVRNGLSPDRIVNLGNATAEELFEAILTKTEIRCSILALGNTLAMGEEIVAYFKNRGEEWLRKPLALV